MASVGTVRRLAVVRLAVVADDLTGAADAAAPFAAHGFGVAVALGPQLPDADVVALSTDNRGRPAAEARERTHRAAGRVRDAERLFVKIDSMLRGQVRADVEGALAAWGAATAVASPAFPAQGRVVRDGALLVHGEPTVPQVAALFPDGVEVVDAETHDALLAVARRLRAGEIAIGSGGLSRALAEILPGAPWSLTADSRAPEQQYGSKVRSVLVVVGTPHPVTRAQIVALDAVPVVSAGAAVDALRAGKRAVLTCEPDGPVEPESPAALALAGGLATAAVAVLDAVPDTGLVLTGGATALAVADALGATELRLHGEVEAGLPLGELIVGPRRVPVVTKSGGFGAPGALAHAAEALEACA
ncbi:four-carbon acid sugar kinase family protein [Pseudonocardia sp. MH-G8]|uniref:four-carbon acid sugar kinase family protein n=1 Tax=Pseudonocardia sp. MH-G8 TaxID=1854588 RepID=UPI0013043102|nr:four-carbon acid sugar kinase family protein [Pseudonocardia sp. MH-G8]